MSQIARVRAIDAPGLSGTAGLMVYSMNVKGSWILSGFAGAARITVVPYKDDARIEAEPVYAELNGIGGGCGSARFGGQPVRGTVYLSRTQISSPKLDVPIREISKLSPEPLPEPPK